MKVNYEKAQFPQKQVRLRLIAPEPHRVLLGVLCEVLDGKHEGAGE